MKCLVFMECSVQSRLRLWVGISSAYDNCWSLDNFQVKLLRDQLCADLFDQNVLTRLYRQVKHINSFCSILRSMLVKLQHVLCLACPIFVKKKKTITNCFRNSAHQRMELTYYWKVFRVHSWYPKIYNSESWMPRWKDY